MIKNFTFEMKISSSCNIIWGNLTETVLQYFIDRNAYWTYWQRKIVLNSFILFVLLTDQLYIFIKQYPLEYKHFNLFIILWLILWTQKFPTFPQCYCFSFPKLVWIIKPMALSLIIKQPLLCLLYFSLQRKLIIN